MTPPSPERTRAPQHNLSPPISQNSPHSRQPRPEVHPTRPPLLSDPANSQHQIRHHAHQDLDRKEPGMAPHYSPPHLDSEPIFPDNPAFRPAVRFGATPSDAIAHHNPTVGQQGNPNMRRKKSLVRPDRAPIDPSHRLYNYRNHAAAMEADERGRVGLSKTGNAAIDGSVALVQEQYDERGHPIELSLNHDSSSALHPSSNAPRHHPGLMAALGRPAPHSHPAPGGAYIGLDRPSHPGLKRGKSVLARGPGEAEESGLAILKRGETLRRRAVKRSMSDADVVAPNTAARKPISSWSIYCRAVTCCFPSVVLGCCGIRTPERIRAWREKMGILFLITILMAAVAFLTFGFTQTVCGKPPLRYHAGSIQPGMMIFHGETYDFDKFQHIGAPGIAAGDNPVYNEFNAGGMDGSFLFQRVNQHCKGFILPASGTGIPNDSSGSLGWYFPCNLYNQFGTSAVNKTGYAQGTLCHTQNSARQAFSKLKPLGQVYYTWDDLKNSTRNLAVYDSAVIDLGLLNWLDRSQVTYPSVFDDLKVSGNSYTGQDITMQVVRAGGKQLGGCLTDIIQVGYIDTNTLGCVASTVVLYASLVVIIGVVLIKWAMAVSFAWFFGWRLGSFGKETKEQRAQRAAEIENWTQDIYRAAPARYRPNARTTKRSLLPNKSRFTMVGPAGGAMAAGGAGGTRPMSTYVGDMNRKSMAFPNKSMLGPGMRNSPPSSPLHAPNSLRNSTSVNSLPHFPGSQRSSVLYRGANAVGGSGGSAEGGVMVTQPAGCPWPLYNVVPQPPPDYEPFNFPLVHTICLVTAYSESVEGLRTTLDSLASTDYPNSHKFILVIADGRVKGSGNDMTTPEICLSMMKEFIVPPPQVQAYSYVAISDGHKRHNQAKVYAGFYDYDDSTIELGQQERIPMILISKTGNTEEQHEAKPGNRGKRDSQVLLMSFLQKVMFDERMTEFDYEFFNAIWRVTGMSPGHYEICLMVDADTKVFPDAISRMAACMVRDSEIMGLCGETKIANKGDTWVTMIQVFEYYISHHLQKSFESMFGGVTCLPGCFSMYRIKAPKGGEGYWVPILANPDIVEHYSENVVDSLHAKNLLLLGEDRFLTTLMLKTFPKRKMMFCPQAVCKTIVPDTFKVLLSQRRRWINSTIHNLFELLFVRDLCGTFCFSMQFVIGMELVGTLVLPAAISFTCYIIILTIIPGTEKPVVSLILLAFILGLPGLLIVITSRRVAYVGWMLIYLLSLPIWNAVLPTYAYFHMDDFTWGETRKVEGAKEKAHGDKEGEFDSSHITMKRWVEFERERRWKSEQQSNIGGLSSDIGLAGGHRSRSPRVTGSKRYSINSSLDNWSGATPADPFGNRPAAVQELSLPQPLAREESLGLMGSGGYIGGHPAANFRVPPIAHQLSQETYPTPDGSDGRASSKEGLLTPTTSRSPLDPHRPEASSPVRATERQAAMRQDSHDRMFGNDEFSHLFQGTGSVESPDEELSLSGSRGFHGLVGDVRSGFGRGVTLSDAGAVPDSMGELRQIDRTRVSSSVEDDTTNNSLPRPPRFGMKF